MRAATKIALYVAALVVVFAGAFGVGTLIGNPISEPAPSETHSGETSSGEGHPAPGHADADPDPEQAAEGAE